MTVSCGHVYHLYLPVASKNKLVVPAYILPDTRVRFFVINSERTEYQIRNPNISDHVISVPRSLNDEFLTHDSWLTCHEPVGGYTETEIDSTPNCYRGVLDEETLAAVRNLIRNSRLYSEQVRGMLLAQWP